jgi:hypothetical protein
MERFQEGEKTEKRWVVGFMGRGSCLKKTWVGMLKINILGTGAGFEVQREKIFVS